MLSAKWQPSPPGFNVLMVYFACEYVNFVKKYQHNFEFLYGESALGGYK